MRVLDSSPPTATRAGPQEDHPARSPANGAARGNLLWQALRDPQAAARLSAGQWDLLVRQARDAKLLARLTEDLDHHGLLEQVPEPVRAHLESARVVAEKQAQVLRWEIYCIERELASCDVPLVLLKGAAYLRLDLPAAAGRLVSDIDLMVPKANLDQVEQTLSAQGWEPLKLHPYDQRYYRTWMHELPPLRHATRRNIIDVHHTILPESGRLRPDPAKLFEAAISADSETIRVLAPPDMILHSAAHLFQDGDLHAGLRDLVDIDRLLRDFQSDPEFWQELVPRARELDLVRPLYYALRWSARVLDTPIPHQVLAEATRVGSPPWPVRRLMDHLIQRALTPEDPERPERTGRVARWLLYVRSHWLRMPPHLLVVHLARKALRRGGEQQEEADS